MNGYLLSLALRGCHVAQTPVAAVPLDHVPHAGAFMAWGGGSAQPGTQPGPSVPSHQEVADLIRREPMTLQNWGTPPRPTDGVAERSQ